MRRFGDVPAVARCCAEEGEKLVVYAGWVLDVRAFAHPGPQSLIGANVGKDITAAFDGRGHSAYAQELCQRLAVGLVGGASKSGQLLLGPGGGGRSAEERAIHKKLDAEVDITKPLMPQVEKMSNREFIAFVRRPRHLDDTDGIRLFEDEEMDEWRKSDYGLNLRMMLPAVAVEVAAAAWLTLAAGEGAWTHFLLLFVLCFCVLGIGIVWTLTEYYFHAIVLHDELRLDPDAPADGKANADLFRRHLHHHVFLNQKYRVALHSSSYYTYLPAGMALVLAAWAGLGVPLPQGLLTHAGWLGGSLLYDGMHYSFHHGPDIQFGWYQKMKAQHMRHHFRDNSIEFGVTNPWWDAIFGTAFAKLKHT